MHQEEITPLPREAERRGGMRQSLSLGALALLTGCDIGNNDPVQGVLAALSRWNDRVQAAQFNPRGWRPRTRKVAQ